MESILTVIISSLITAVLVLGLVLIIGVPASFFANLIIRKECSLNPGRDILKAIGGTLGVITVLSIIFQLVMHFDLNIDWSWIPDWIGTVFTWGILAMCIVYTYELVMNIFCKEWNPIKWR